MKFNEYIDKSTFGKREIEKIGQYKVCLVNGNTIRNSDEANEEFGEFATHYQFPKLIPEKEIWIEKDVKEEERKYLIDNALYQIKLIGSGVSRAKAYDKALLKEKREREAGKSGKFGGYNVPPPKKLYKKHYGYISEANIEVYLVDAELVRDTWKTDFLEGGNNCGENRGIYPFIPENQIWIESGISGKEIPYILLHEFIERQLMLYRKLVYDDAHKIASMVEFYMRPKEFDQHDVLSLTTDKAFELVIKACDHVKK